MNGERNIRPIAYIHTDFSQKFGIPRQSGRVPELIGRIIFEPEYNVADALREIESFSHLWLIFDFSESHRDSWSPTVRPPRLGGNRRVGVFASRSPFRPNNLGLSCVELLSVKYNEKEGNVLIVGGADLLDGTPIYDIKPYLSFSDAHIDARNGYAESEKEHRLEVIFPDEIIQAVPEEKRTALIACLADDPRPSYQDDGRGYTMRFSCFDVSFTVANGILNVTDVKKV